MPANASLADIGLDYDGRETGLRLFYSPPADTLIAVLEPRRPITLDKRIFIRHRGETCYREVSLPHPLASIAAVAACAGRPMMFLNVFSYRNAARAGADFECVARVHLPEGVAERLPAPVLVATPQWEGPTMPTDLWIDDILAVSTDGRQLFVIGAIVVPTGETLQSVHVERWISTFDVGDGSLRPLSELPAGFA